MSKKDPVQEQKQLDAISASIKDKMKEVKVFDDHMKTAQAELDKKRDEIDVIRQDVAKEQQELGLKVDDFEKQRKAIDSDLEEIKMKRVALDKLAKASDDRLVEANATKKKNEKTLKEIEEKSVTVDTTNDDLCRELEGKMQEVEELKRLKGEEYMKSKVQLEALKTERAEIQDNKVKYELLVKEVTETKGELASQLNKNKDIEQKLQKVQVDLKNREQNCSAREDILKDAEVEIEARWAKVLRREEISGFAKEIADAKKDQLDEGR